MKKYDPGAAMNKITAIGLGLVLSQASLASADLDKLQSLFNSGQSLQAYEYGNNIQSQYEGDPRFDYYFGAAAIDAGNASQGVFALERVLIDDPSNNAARLELARGYFTLEEYARSRQEFEAVLENNPPPAVKSKIEQYIDAIRLRESRYTTTSQFYFRSGIGTDSNVNAAPSDTAINFPGFTLANFSLNLPSTSLERDSTVGELDVGATINAPITATLSAFGGSRLKVIHNSDESDFNNEALDMNVGLRHRTGQHLFTYKIGHQSYILDSNFYRNTSLFNLQYQYQFNSNNALQLFAQNTQTDYIKNPEQDTRMLLAGTGYLKQFPMKFSPILSASLYLGEEKPEKNTQSNRAQLGRKLQGISFSGQVQLTPQSSLRASLTLQQSNAPERFPVKSDASGNITLPSPEKKEDDFINYGLQFTQLLSRNWKLRADFDSSDNDSNVNQSDYKRNRFMLNFIYGH